jgi:hypothetical protein
LVYLCIIFLHLHSSQGVQSFIPNLNTHSISQSVNSLIHSATLSVTTSLSYFPRFYFSHYVDKSRYARRIRNELFTFPRVPQRCNALRNYSSCRDTDCNLLITLSFQHLTAFLAACDLKVEC